MLGLALTRWTPALIVHSLSIDSSAIYLDTRPDRAVLLFALVASVVTALLFGLAPAMQVTRVDLESTLREGTRDSGNTRMQRTMRSGLIVAQIAISFTLLMCAALSIQTLRHLENRKLGYDIDNVLLVRIDPSQGNYGPVNWNDRYRDTLARIRDVSEVRNASLARMTPLDGDRWNREISPEGYVPRSGEDMRVLFNVVGPEFFHALSVPLLAGRACQVSDSQSDRSVAVVSEQLVRRFFKTRNVVGQTLTTVKGPQPEVIEIVGVVEDMMATSLRGTSLPTVFLCATRNPKQFQAVTFVIRTRGKGQGLEDTLRKIVRQTMPGIPLQVETLKSRADQSVQRERLIAWLASAFGAIAIILSAAGLYGLVAYSAARRTKEIAVRMALGARRSNVLWLITRQTLLLAGAGLVIGLPVALSLAHFARALLFGLGPNDIESLLLTSLIILCIAILAGYFPAKRAVALEPSAALRYE